MKHHHRCPFPSSETERSGICFRALYNQPQFGVPMSNFPALMSTPMIRSAPAALHPMMVASPTAPRPHTAQVEPFSTCQCQSRSSLQRGNLELKQQKIECLRTALEQCSAQHRSQWISHSRAGKLCPKELSRQPGTPKEAHNSQRVNDTCGSDANAVCQCTLHNEMSATTVYSLNVEVPMK